MNRRGSVALIILSLVIFVISLGAFVFFSFVKQTGTINSPTNQYAAFIIATIFFILTLGLIIHQVLCGGGKIRKLLQMFNDALIHDSLENLKAQYLAIYNSYLSLSSKQKQNFYGKVMKAREAVENIMTTEKKMEKLLQTAHSQIAKKKEVYEEFSSLYAILPLAEQEKFHSDLVELQGTS